DAGRRREWWPGRGLAPRPRPGARRAYRAVAWCRAWALAPRRAGGHSRTGARRLAEPAVDGRPGHVLQPRGRLVDPVGVEHYSWGSVMISCVSPDTLRKFLWRTTAAISDGWPPSSPGMLPIGRSSPAKPEYTCHK